MKDFMDDIIKYIAEKEGISENEVIESLQNIIDVGYYNENPAVRAEWEKTPFDGKPEPREFMLYFAVKVKEQMDKYR